MKIKQESVDFSEEQMIAFAKFLGWSENVVGVDENGVELKDGNNQPLIVPNPYTYGMFLADRYNALPLEDLKAFNVAQVKAEKAAELLAAEEQVKNMVKDFVTVIIE